MPSKKDVLKMVQLPSLPGVTESLQLPEEVMELLSTPDSLATQKVGGRTVTLALVSKMPLSKDTAI